MWALVFTALHLAWAAGWYVGLHQESARRAFEQRWFLVYDVIVAGVCALGVFVALGLVQTWGLRVPRFLMSVLAWGGTGALALRGGAGALQASYLAATGRLVSPVAWFWEGWFCLGALLFGLCSWRFGRVSRGVP